jgi:hypothetical protein
LVVLAALVVLAMLQELQQGPCGLLRQLLLLAWV